MDFGLLGPLEVTSDGQPIELRAKERVLLAVLLLHANEAVSTQRLVDEIWGPQPPASATKLVATYVWQLRKSLGDTIVTRSPGYAAVVSPDELDVARFGTLVARAQTEQPVDAAATLREALELWRGPALADVVFESSAAGDVLRLDDERLSALAMRIDHDLALGRHDDILGELQALVRAHPFRERFRSQLMLTLYRSGRQAEALESYRDARRRYVDELGIEPGPELQRLERAILAHDPGLDSDLGSVASTGRPVAGTNLPRPVSSFVGREQELGDVRSAIADGTRLLSLTGPGGAGKTRLALEAAYTLAPEFDAGALWVGLAPLRDHTLVLEAVGQAVGAKDDVAEHIGGQEVLLLVDNLEHVMEAAPELASLLARCPNLTMLVTSRERMRVQGELEYPVPPLSETEAVALFCRRAHTEPSPDIAALCARLDNLPLAVELAAARAKALSPAQILERLSEGFELLRGGRDADPRQQTLRATIQWSHQLLATEERALFARLSVFPAGCSFDAAFNVCEAELETVEALVEKSLVRFSGERYSMLETVREYAVERLSESGELDGVMKRLARYLVDLANEEGAPLYHGRASEAYERLDLEHANVRAVVDWAVASAQYAIVAELVVVLREVWTNRGRLVEAVRWSEQALAARGNVTEELWPLVLLAVSHVRLMADDRAGARTLNEEALEAGTDPYLEAICLSELSLLSCQDGDLEEARRFAERSLELRMEHGLSVGRALMDLGHIAFLAGDLGEARRQLEEARMSLRVSGAEHNLALTTRMLAEVARRQGAHEEAATLLVDALVGVAELGDVDAAGACLRDLAVVAKERGDNERAARLWSTGIALAQSDPTEWERGVFPQEIGDLPALESEPSEVTLEDALALASET